MECNPASLWLDHGGANLNLEFSPDGQFLIAASCGSDHGEGAKGEPIKYIHLPGVAVLWSTKDWTERARFHDDYFNGIAWHPKKHILATSSRYRITLWDIVAEQPVRRFLELEVASPAEYSALAFAPDGQSLAVTAENGFPDADVLVLNSETGEAVRRLSKLNDDRSVCHLKFLSDSKHIVGTSCSYKFSFDRAYLWDAIQGTQLTTFDFNEDGYGTKVFQIELSLDGRVLVSSEYEAAEDQSSTKSSFTIRLWDSLNGRELAEHTMPGKCFCFAISPDGSLLATMSAKVRSDYSLTFQKSPDYILTLLDLPSGYVRASLKSPNQAGNLLFYRPEILRFSPDGRWLAVGHWKHVEIWDIKQIMSTDVLGTMPEYDYAGELRRLTTGLLPDENPFDGPPIWFTAICRGDAEDVLRRVKEILVTMIAFEEQVASLQEGAPAMPSLPDWFVSSFADQPEPPYDEWTLAGWLQYFPRDFDSDWIWWDATIVSPDLVYFSVEVGGFPFSSGTLYQLFKVCGALRVEECMRPH